MKTRRRQKGMLPILRLAHDRVAIPIARTNEPAVIDVTISEWNADLFPSSRTSVAVASGGPVANSYVDFDTLDSVHETV